jgi:hypothetical protein
VEGYLQVPETLSAYHAKKFHTYQATHTGWLLLAPLYLAYVDTEAPVPIPRWGWLEWWTDANFWFNDYAIQPLVGLMWPEAVGYLFWSVRELAEPIEIEVEAG